MKRKRIAVPNGVIPDGNYTPSDSDSDEEVLTPKIVCRRSSSASDRGEPSHNDQPHRNAHNQLLYAALDKIQELEDELAELDEAGYDSGHQDDEDDDDNIDEGSASDLDSNHERQPSASHDHHDAILNGQPEELGFAFCIKETFDYLSRQGVSADNPIVTALRERFLGQCDDV